MGTNPYWGYQTVVPSVVVPKYLPNYMKEDSPQKQGRKQEKKATQHINSGAVWFDLGDLTVMETNENYHVDTKKVVLQKGFNLSLKDVDKLYNEAGSKTPMFLIYIGDYLVKAVVQKIHKKRNY